MYRDPNATRTDAQYRQPRRAPPVAVSMAVAAVPPMAVFAMTHPMVVVAFVVTATVFAVSRGHPGGE